MTLSDPLPITPFTRCLDSSVALPGSKSITNRALILAALAEGETVLTGALFSRDTTIMVTALKALGFACEDDRAKQTITVGGLGGKIPAKEATLHVGNAGTAARFLTAFLALEAGGVYYLDGDAAMRTRPMSGLLDALVALDAAEFEFHGEVGFFPFTLKAKGFSGGDAKVDASASSQILSALLMVAPVGKGAVRLECPWVRPSYVGITLKMREAFGASPVEATESGVYALPEVAYKAPKGRRYAIEPDVSAASYLLALTLIQGGRLEIPNLGPDPLQGDAHFVEVLAHHGLRVDADRDMWVAACLDPEGVQRDHREIDFNSISDTFLTYAAMAPLLGGGHSSDVVHVEVQMERTDEGMAKGTLTVVTDQDGQEVEQVKVFEGTATEVQEAITTAESELGVTKK